jgi:predicted CXXCH cytochrome family protein
MALRTAKTWWVGLSGVALIVCGTQLRAQTRQSAPSAAKHPEPAYVNPTICARCHPEIARTYSLTGMGRSVTLPDPKTAVKDYQGRNTVYNRPSGLYYTMVERDGAFYQHRHELGFDGKETNVVEERVDYVIGSGNHCRSYLHRTPDGQLIELPVTWYTEGSGYWAMSPGYDAPRQPDFRRAVDGTCLACHNGFPPGEKYPDPTSSGVSIFPKDIPAGIDCQRCHGPGGSHVQAALSGKASAEEIRQAIVNPARLSRDRQMEVCMQCHLETDSGLKPNELRRHGWELDGYRPGQPLGDFKIFFDRPATGKDDRFQIAHQAYRLRMSACFRNSAMTCLTCHDPHQSYRTADSTQHYLQVCQGCHPSVAHQTALPASADCLSCHMPKRRTDDAVHVVMTDHYIQRLKPSRDLLAPLAEVHDGSGMLGGVALYYPPHLPSTPESELYLALAEVKNGANLPSAIARLQDALSKLPPADPDVYFEIGDACSKGGKDDEAIHWYNEALRRRASFRPAIKQLAQALIDQGRFAQAVQVLRPAAAVPPADDGLFAELGDAYLHLRQFDLARQALQRAIEIDPEQPEARNFLGLMALKKDDAAEAEARFRDAVRYRPDYAEAYNNLGNVLAANHQYAEAAYDFQRAIAIDPQNAEAHHSYAWMLAMSPPYDRAIAEFRKALALKPRDAQTHNDLADILVAQGHPDEAADEYRQAIRLKPDLVEAHSSLGNLLATQRNYEEAKREFTTAIQLQPDYYQAHLALGMILLREGNAAEARAHYQKALASPDPALRSAAQQALEETGR